MSKRKNNEEKIIKIINSKIDFYTPNYDNIRNKIVNEENIENKEKKNNWFNELINNKTFRRCFSVLLIIVLFTIIILPIGIDIKNNKSEQPSSYPNSKPSPAPGEISSYPSDNPSVPSFNYKADSIYNSDGIEININNYYSEFSSMPSDKNNLPICICLNINSFDIVTIFNYFSISLNDEEKIIINNNDKYTLSFYSKRDKTNNISLTNRNTNKNIEFETNYDYANILQMFDNEYNIDVSVFYISIENETLKFKTIYQNKVYVLKNVY